MAKRSGAAQAGSQAAGVPPSFDRLTNLVALLLVKGEPQVDQIRTLAAAGFSNTEIAQLLGLTANNVNVALHRLRKRQ